MTKLYNSIKRLGDILADQIADFMGSWSYMLWFFIISVVYMAYNLITPKPFDPWAFSGLNLLLGFAASLSAPIVIMAGNRSDAKKRKQAELDFQVDKDTNKRIKEIEKDLKEIKELLKK